MPNKQAYLGEFEHVVMLSILSLKDNAYGVSIRHHLSSSIGRDVSIGALYSTAERLEKKGYLTSKKSGASAARGGKAKRFFSVSALGIQALQYTKSQLDTLWEQASFNILVNEGELL